MERWYSNERRSTLRQLYIAPFDNGNHTPLNNNITSRRGHVKGENQTKLVFTKTDHINEKGNKENNQMYGNNQHGREMDTSMYKNEDLQSVAALSESAETIIPNSQITESHSRISQDPVYVPSSMPLAANLIPSSYPWENEMGGYLSKSTTIDSTIHEKTTQNKNQLESEEMHNDIPESQYWLPMDMRSDTSLNSEEVYSTPSGTSSTDDNEQSASKNLIINNEIPDSQYSNFADTPLSLEEEEAEEEEEDGVDEEDPDASPSISIVSGLQYTYKSGYYQVENPSLISAPNQRHRQQQPPISSASLPTASPSQYHNTVDYFEPVFDTFLPPQESMFSHDSSSVPVPPSFPDQY